MTGSKSILSRVDGGVPSAAADLLALPYEELRRLAADRMRREGAERTLGATGLVQEAYLRLGGDPEQEWKGRAHFFGAAAEAMRRILVEEARRRVSLKRGDGRVRAELDVSQLGRPRAGVGPDRAGRGDRAPGSGGSRDG